MQKFDLADEDDSEKYYALLEYITKKNLELPILSKGTIRMIDMGVNKAKKIDKEIRFLLDARLPLKEQIIVTN